MLVLLLLLAGLLFASCQGPKNQEPVPQVLTGDYEADLQGQWDRTAGLFHSYEGIPGPQTAAPKGYEPFYVSHYGRHGSRRQIGGGGTVAWTLLNEASQAGILTPKGDSLFQDVSRLYDQHVGMDGELTLRGGQEHQGIARRMYKRFRPAFDNGGKVHCQSSKIRRCLISMSNFTGALWSQAPELEMDFITGDPTQTVIMHDYYEYDEATLNRSVALEDSVLHALVNPQHMMEAFFLPGPQTAAVVPDPYRFAKYLFYIAADAQDLLLEAGPVDVFRYFTREELLALSKFFNEKYYQTFGNTVEFGKYLRWQAKWLLEDVVNRADAALAAGNVAADLRFGHDSALFPLASLIGLDPMGTEIPAGKASESNMYLWKYLCMGSNLQMAFYKNKAGSVLVKFLYNEQETTIPALASSAPAPYYDWEELRPYLLALCTDKSL